MAKARDRASIFAHEPGTTEPSTDSAQLGRPDEPQRAQLAVKGVEFESTAAFGKPGPDQSDKIDLSNPLGQPVTSQTWEMAAPSLNPNLADMYRQREIDLGHTNVDQTVQKFAADVKQIDAQTAGQPSIAASTPAPTTPAPTTPAPTPAPTAAPAPTPSMSPSL